MTGTPFADHPLPWERTPGGQPLPSIDLPWLGGAEGPTRFELCASSEALCIDDSPLKPADIRAGRIKAAASDEDEDDDSGGGEELEDDDDVDTGVGDNNGLSDEEFDEDFDDDFDDEWDEDFDDETGDEEFSDLEGDDGTLTKDDGDEDEEFEAEEFE